MQALVLFGVVLVLMGVSFAIPIGALRQHSVREQDAPVLGATVLTIALGTLNLLALAWFSIRGEISLSTLPFGLAPIAAGALGASVVRAHLSGPRRTLRIVLAAGLAIAGLPGYFAVNVALFAALIAAGAFLAGLIRNPGSLFRSLDPRL